MAAQLGTDRNCSILVVDDDINMLDSVSSLLNAYGFTATACRYALEASEQIIAADFKAILTDIKMPDISGIELLDRIHNVDSTIPVILMTAYAELDVAIDAIKKGAFDFITKPFKPEHLIHTIERAVNYSRLMQLEQTYKHMLEEKVKLRTEELKGALTRIEGLNREIILRLTAAAEFRDTDTGFHISRMEFYSKKISEALGMPNDFIETIACASPLHDIGKIGIPDEILLKPAPLSPAEFEIMKSHTIIGNNILSESSHPLIKMGESISLNHHERWDGTGYPRGIKGHDIPIEGRIINICDQYDALMSVRPYKPSLTHQESYTIITEGDGRTMPGHFDHDVLEAFKKVSHSFEEMYHSYIC